MIDFLFAALLQTTIGDPTAAQPQEAPAAQVEVAAETANATPETTWTCRFEQRTGSRLDRRRVCRRQADEERLRDALGNDLRDRAAIVAVDPTPP